MMALIKFENLMFFFWDESILKKVIYVLNA